MRAALRYRRGQAVALALLAALVATCATFAPTYGRAVDEAVVHEAVAAEGRSTTVLTLSQERTVGDPQVGSDDLLARVPGSIRDASDDAIRSMALPSEVVPRAGKLPSPTVVRSRTGMCEHLRIRGRCPAAADEVIVSSADARAWGWRSGTALTVPLDTVTREVQVVGVYDVAGDPGYWLGDPPDGRSGVLTDGADLVPALDDLLTVEEIYDDGRPVSTATVELPLRGEALTLSTVDTVVAEVAQLRREHPEMGVALPLADELPSIEASRAQTAVIVPLVMSQLGLLGAVALYLVARGAVDQRRHDIALARLRGRSRRSAIRAVAVELGVCVAAGVVLGAVVGMALAVLTARSPCRRGSRWGCLPPSCRGCWAPCSSPQPRCCSPCAPCAGRAWPRCCGPRVRPVDG